MNVGASVTIVDCPPEPAKEEEEVGEKRKRETKD